MCLHSRDPGPILSLGSLPSLLSLEAKLASYSLITHLYRSCASFPTLLWPFPWQMEAQDTQRLLEGVGRARGRKGEGAGPSTEPLVAEHSLSAVELPVNFPKA